MIRAIDKKGKVIDVVLWDESSEALQEIKHLIRNNPEFTVKSYHGVVNHALSNGESRHILKISKGDKIIFVEENCYVTFVDGELILNELMFYGDLFETLEILCLDIHLKSGTVLSGEFDETAQNNVVMCFKNYNVEKYVVPLDSIDFIERK